MNPTGPPTVVPVILSGGSGSRLWPLSSEAAPKQFHGLVEERTLIQQTALRLMNQAGLALAAPIIICNARHEALLRAQLAQVGIKPSAVILEPIGRSTAAAAIVAARIAMEMHPGALVVLAPADHVISDVDAFGGVMAQGALVRDRIVTFGVRPTRPETGYGYIQRGAPLTDGVFEVARFVEKPGRETAEVYLAAGDYDWNAGIFLFAPELLLREMQVLRPDILSATDAALDAREPRPGGFALPLGLFEKIPAESLDIAVMERTSKAAVAPFDAGWADLGAWDEVWRLSERDSAANVIRGEALAIDSEGSLLWGDGRLVAALGVEDLIVVATDEAVVVLPRARAQEMKALVEAVMARRKGPGVRGE
jgi:mannose-1-phosphate guanylyltransferase/mannose-6-phosphate isomerase